MFTYLQEFSQDGGFAGTSARTSNWKQTVRKGLRGSISVKQHGCIV